MIVDKMTFFECQKRVGRIPFTQSEEWLEANIPDGEVVYFVDNVENPSFCCFGNFYQQRFVGKRLIINGVTYSNPIDSDKMRDYFKEIKDQGFDVVTVSDISLAYPDFEVGIRRAGFVRPFGLNLCPMTIMVDLQKTPSYHRNWKRNVKKSIAAGNTLVHVDRPQEKDADDFVSLFVKMQDRKALGYMITTESIYFLLKGNYDLFFIEDAKGCRIAGRIEYFCDDCVYDIYAANTTEGVNSGAAYHIQQGVFEYYKEKGATVFDYGRIPPSDGPMDNIYKAKRYSGGYPVIYNGQWIYSKKISKLYLLSINSFIRNKQIFY